MRSLCNEWEFTPEWFDGFALGEGQGDPVRLPHTVAELPLPPIRAAMALEPTGSAERM